MNIYRLIGRNIELTEAMKSYAEEKLARLDRFSDQIVDASVVMSYNERISGEPAKVEVQVNVPGGIVRAEERGLDHYAAIDLMMEKLERQLKKYKGRSLAKRSEEKPSAEEPVDTDDSPRIVRTKRHTMRPMAPEDAAMQMEALGHDFYVFHNVDNDGINVLYLREDGNYGLIEPA